MKRALVVLTLFALMLSATAAFADGHLKPRIENFVYLLDSSGSMGFEYLATGRPKVELGKEAIAAMNKITPELGYKGALYALAPFTEYQPLKPFAQKAYGAEVSRLNTDVLSMGFIGHATPLGEGIADLQASLPELEGRTAVILLSDGGNNRGKDPVSIAQKLYDKYDGKLCYHIVSYAESARDHRILEDIAKISECNSVIKASDISTEAGRKAFVENVFYTTAPAAPKKVAAAPKDSDGDGIYDKDDKCPGTPLGTPINMLGCPADSDGDGVIDFYDKCPGTPMEAEVDADGCPIPVTISLNVEFDTAKANVKAKYHDEIKRVADFMKMHPDSTAVIEGHTDSVGKASYNQMLSEKRAKSVRDYIVTKFGVEASRLKAVGFGEERPVASNDNAKGREMNRRVDAVISGAYEMR